MPHRNIGGWLGLSVAGVLLWLVGCVSGVEQMPSGLTVHEQALVRDILRWDQELIGSNEDSKRRFAAMMVRCGRGEPAALDDLFNMSQEGIDGAAAEGYAGYLADVMYAAGDTQFGQALAKQPQAVQAEVRGLVLHALGVPTFKGHRDLDRRFPQTFPPDTLVFTFDAVKGDPWKGGGFADVLARYADVKFAGPDKIAPIVDLDYVAIPDGFYNQAVYLVCYDWSTDWLGGWDVVGVRSGQIEWSAAINERRSIRDAWSRFQPSTQSIDSVRVVLLEGQNNPFIEVIGTTHMGHGELYLYELDRRELRLVLATTARDAHQDQNLIEGLNLHRDYRDLNGDGYTDLRLHGVGLTYNEDDSKTIRQRIPLQKDYTWSTKDNHFVTDPSRWLGWGQVYGE